MDNSYGPLFASYIAKIIFRNIAAAFIAGVGVGILIMWIFA